MNLPPLRNAALRSFYDAPGSPSSFQVDLSSQQMRSKEGAMEGVERSQTMAGAAEIMKELGMATSNEQAKANALLLNTIAGVQGAALQAGYDLPGKRAMMGMFPGMNSDQVINAII